MIRNRPAVRLTVGYTFHSWELLGMWAWVPAFLVAALAASESGGLQGVEFGAYLAGSFHIMGWLASSSMRSEEHTYELQSLMRISYAVFCLKNKNNRTMTNHTL